MANDDNRVIEKLRGHVVVLERRIRELEDQLSKNRRVLVVIMAVKIHPRYAEVCWVKLERRLGPLEALDAWTSHVEWEDCQRKVTPPNAKKVGVATGVGVTRSFEQRIADRAKEHRVDVLLWDGDEELLGEITSSLWWGKKGRHGARQVREESFPILDQGDMVKRKMGCERSLAAVLELVRTDDWEEIL